MFNTTNKELDELEKQAKKINFIVPISPETLLRLISDLRMLKMLAIYKPTSKMEWIQDKPTVKGMYWCRCIDPCKRIAGPANIMYYTPGHELVEIYDEFAGPIPEPIEPIKEK